MCKTLIYRLYQFLYLIGVGFYICINSYASDNIRFNKIGFNEGLTQNTVNDIYYDSYGYIWVATEIGVNRYDGYEMSSYVYDPNTLNSISGYVVTSIVEDSNRNMWFGSRDGGVSYFDRQQELFSQIEFIHKQNKKLNKITVTSLVSDVNGYIWVGTQIHGLFRVNTQTMKAEYVDYQVDNALTEFNREIHALHIDKNNKLWIGGEQGVEIVGLNGDRLPVFNNFIKLGNVLSYAEENNGAIWIGTTKGLNYYINGSIKRKYNNVLNGLLDSMIQSLFVDFDNELWVGTNSGLHLYDRNNDRFIAYRNDNSDINSISSGIVNTITADNSQNIWLGLRGSGVNYFNKRLRVFAHYRQNRNGISAASVFSVLEDHHKMIWIGTEGGGVNLLNPETGLIKYYRHDRFNERSISGDYVGYIYQSETDNLWLATYYNGINRINLKTNEFYNKWTGSEGLDFIRSNRITSMFEMKKNLFYFSTYNNGLIKINMDNQQFKHYQYDSFESTTISSNSLRSMIYAKDGNIWIGTETSGVNVFDPIKEKFVHYRYENGLSNDSVISLLEDSTGNIWVGTANGLNKFGSVSRNITHYTKDDGLADNVIYAILEDKAHHIWVSTNIGLSRLNPNTGVIKNYYVHDGLQSNEFNAEAATTSHDGRLYFGGINGVTAFYPDKLKSDSIPPKVRITDFFIKNKKVPLKSHNLVAGNRSYLLDKVIDLISSLTLSYRESSFSFEFAALSFYDPKRNQYAYMLQGWDKNWISTDYRARRATYTNIPAGQYIFKVKASNSDGVWNKEGRKIYLHILSPPWLSWWAYLFYILICMYVLYYFVQLQNKKIFYKQQELEREKEISRQLKKVDRLKDDFLASTSHELRTPLNGIIGLAESLIDGIAGNLNEQTKKNLGMIINSSRRLSNLVNDILDFSKMRNDKITLQFSPVDLKPIVDAVVALSAHLINDKSIAILNLIPDDFPLLKADGSRLQQIFYNLLGNAIKFTNKGQINITARVFDEKAEISISDPGIGIAEDQLDNIFISFEQGRGDDSREFCGTGIGLAVTKQLVELHGGRIVVKSKLNHGSIFSFTLDLSDDQSKKRGLDLEQDITKLIHLDNDACPDINIPVFDALPVKIEKLVSNTEKKFKILIVDDEKINRQVLINYLSVFNYEIKEADCGVRALNLINEEKDFDLVLLDIMMPKLSGYQVCSSIREQYGVNELPVIFLTAKNQVSDLVESFAVGANDYLSKPVAKYELISRLSTHLQLLDIHRNLENKIEERTRELININQELETLHSIIITINKPIDLELLLDVLITEGVGLFPQATTGCYLHRQENGEYFKVTASYGFKKNDNSALISPADVNFYYTVYSDEIENNVYIVKPNDKFIPIDNCPVPKVMLVMRVDFEGELSGILILNNYSNVTAFDKSDLKKLLNFHEHVKTAITKALLLQRSNKLLDTIKEKNNAIIEAQNQLIMQEKMVTLGNLTDGVAHEINNPVNFVHVSLDNLSHDLACFKDFLFAIASDDADKTVLARLEKHFSTLEGHVDIIKNGSKRVRYIVDCLRNLSKPDSIALTTLNIRSSISSILHLIKIKYENIVDFEYNCTSDAEMNCYVSQINQVFMSLIINACEAVEKKYKAEEVKGYVKINSYKKDQHLVVEISDNGCGMDEKMQGKVFEPFFTTKEVGDGTGLGLSMAHTAIKNHDGEIEVTSSVGSGSCFTLRFPDNSC